MKLEVFWYFSLREDIAMKGGEVVCVVGELRFVCRDCRFESVEILRAWQPLYSHKRLAGMSEAADESTLHRQTSIPA